MALQHKPIKLALADDDLRGFGEDLLPTVQFSGRAGRGKHLGTGSLVLRIFRQLEEREVPFATKDRDGYAAAVPAQKMPVNHVARNSTRLTQVAADVRGQVAVALLGKLWALGHSA